jgi:hypothetical protein
MAANVSRPTASVKRCRWYMGARIARNDATDWHFTSGRNASQDADYSPKVAMWLLKTGRNRSEVTAALLNELSCERMMGREWWRPQHGTGKRAHRLRNAGRSHVSHSNLVGQFESGTIVDRSGRRAKQESRSAPFRCRAANERPRFRRIPIHCRRLLSARWYPFLSGAEIRACFRTVRGLHALARLQL